MAGPVRAIQALALGIRKECSCRKMAAGNTTIGSTPPCLAEPQNTIGLQKSALDPWQYRKTRLKMGVEAHQRKISHVQLRFLE